MRTDDGVDRTNVDTFAATDAARFINHRAAARFMCTELRVKRLRREVQQAREQANRRLAAGWTLIDFGRAARERFCICLTMRIAATCALRLRQRGIEFFRKRRIGGSPHARSMASPAACGNNGDVTERLSFRERGGWWVAAQIPLLLVAFLLAPWFSYGQSTFVRPVQYLGTLVIFVGFGIIAAALFGLGASLSPFPRPHRDSRLVTRGIYRYMRHPIYSGLIAGSLGWGLVWLSPAGVLYSAVVALFFDRKARREEIWLMQRYPEYAAYARRVRRFLPSVY